MSLNSVLCDYEIEVNTSLQFRSDKFCLHEFTINCTSAFSSGWTVEWRGISKPWIRVGITHSIHREPRLFLCLSIMSSYYGTYASCSPEVTLKSLPPAPSTGHIKRKRCQERRNLTLSTNTWCFLLPGSGQIHCSSWRLP